MSKIHDFPSAARRDLHNVTGWLADLANMTAGTSPLADAKAKIASLASGLVEEYPPAAFTRASLLHVARQCKFMPSYAELTTHLTAWWNDNRPILPALPAPYEHVETPERTRPTTEGLADIRNLIARNDTFLHAQYDALYGRPTELPAAGQYRPAPQLTRERLNADYANGSLRGPKVPS